MDVVMASIYAVCAFAVGFAFGVVASRLVQGQKLKQAQDKAREVALKDVKDKTEVDLGVSVLSSGDKVDVVEADVKQALD